MKTTENQKNNKVAGTWLMVSAQLDPNGKNLPLYGPTPKGIVIFTEDFYFTDVIVNPDIPKFKSNDRLSGTPEENKAAMSGSLGVYGTYTVDSEGDFLNEHIIASTFPNWIDIRRDRSLITETVDSDKMTEKLKLDDGTDVVIIWRKVK